MQELQTLLEEIGKHWGWEIGDKVRQEINAVIAAQDMDIDQLQSAIETIQGLLDADPSTEEFDVGQNIVTQLSDHLNRITNLETDVTRLKGGESTVGSVAYAVKQERDRAQAAEAALQSDIDANEAAINTLNSDETVDGSVAKTVKNAVDSEKAAREASDADLQAQIDNLSGGGSGSIASVQSELDATQAGAGLNEDGTYSAKTDANYIADATSLKDADEKLDAALKSVDDRVSVNEASVNTLNGDETVDGSVAKTAKGYADTAEANANTYTDNEINALKNSIASISAATLASIFRRALDCGFAGESKDDVLNGTGNCQTANGGGDDGGDGAVL
jgi:hypothetical protein